MGQLGARSGYVDSFTDKMSDKQQRLAVTASPEPVQTIIETRNWATAEIARDADDAIQGHSRSSIIVVPIDAAYMTSC